MMFRREGDYWTLAYEGRLVRLRDAKGLHYLGQLLRHADREFEVGDLVARTFRVQRRPHHDRPSEIARNAERARKAVTNRIRQAIARIAELHPELGRHLLNSVRTGGRCAYTPERKLRWSEDGRA